MLTREKGVDSMLPVEKTAGLNVTEGMRRKSYSAWGSDRGGEEESEGVCGGLRPYSRELLTSECNISCM